MRQDFVEYMRKKKPRGIKSEDVEIRSEEQ